MKLTKEQGYQWKYCTLGGATRVKITSGEDIAHLAELDQKKWTALSCPTTNLEFDKATLTILDTDADGVVRVPEVIAAAQWLTSRVADKDTILEARQEVALGDLVPGCDVAAAIESLGVEKISLADVAALEADLKAAAATGEVAPVEAPFAEATDSVIAAYKAVDTKVADFFTRCHLVAFNADCAAALDDSVAKITAIASENLATCGAKIAECPIATPNADALLPISKGLNPEWKAKVEAVAAGCGLKKDIDEATWAEIGAKIAAYEGAVATAKGAVVSTFEAENSAKLAAVALVDKFLHLYCHFYQFLRNYVTFDDFYATDALAVFQAGTLYVDQRSCDLCIRVADMGKHGDMAGLSGMYILYCKCTSKTKGTTMDIAAVVTDGDIDGFRVGKNGIFYDRNGLDWNAEITKIVDNPISIRQAFWSPYKKLARWVSERINKMAADKEAKSTENLLKNAETQSAQAATGTPAEAPKSFDVAKFAGIFAAIGLAIGAIGGFLAAFIDVITKPVWAAPLYIIGIMLLISLPSMFNAWLKLRKRNLGPVLNANGWAVNSQILVNTRFGATLTDLVKYPLLRGADLKDPYAEKKTPCWVKCLIVLGVLLGIAAVLWFTNCFGFYDIQALCQ